MVHEAAKHLSASDGVLSAEAGLQSCFESCRTQLPEAIIQSSAGYPIEPVVLTWSRCHNGTRGETTFARGGAGARKGKPTTRSANWCALGFRDALGRNVRLAQHKPDHLRTAEGTIGLGLGLG